MNDLHPHWQSDDDAHEVPLDVADAPGTHISIKAASRLPAAVVGIALCAAVGFTAVGGWQALTAQVTPQNGGASSSSSSDANAPIDVHITSSGFDPQTVMAHPGQTITWINDQSIPHILTSQTLRNGSGVFLNTPAIFPGDKTSFVIDRFAQDQQHTVNSTTDQNIVGTIFVTGAAVESGTSSPRALPLGSLDGVGLPTGQGAGQFAQTSSRRGTALQGLAAGQLEAQQSSGAPVAAVDQTSSDPTLYAAAPTTVPTDTLPPPPPPSNGLVPANSLPPQALIPNTQPETGPELWIVCAVSLGALAFVCRRQMMRPGKWIA